VKRIPKIDKLKQQIIELPPAEAERLHDWLTMLTDVRRDEIKRQEAKKESSQK